jgi:hypothetical protein
MLEACIWYIVEAHGCYGIYTRHIFWYIVEALTCLRHIFGAWFEAHIWHMYEVHFLVMLMHVETHLGDVMVHCL